MNHFQDRINLLFRLTPRKIRNATRLYISYHLSRWLKRSFHNGMPMAISIEPTTACNLQCPECPSGLRKFSRATGNLKEDYFTQIIDQLSNDLLYLTFYFQGEPYINPNFLNMVSYASKKGIYTATSTNAHFLTNEIAKQTVLSGLDRLIISIDGSTQETYEKYRIAGHLEKVLEGARNVIKQKKELNSKTPHIIFQCLVVSHNEHQIDDIFKLAEETGVDEVRLKTAQVYDYKNGNSLFPSNENYSRYRRNEDGTYSIKNKLLNQCWRMWSSCVITWDGLIVPCCFDKDATHQFGDTKKEDFRTVWRGDKYNAFRRAILHSRDKIEICKNCTEGTKVWT